MHDAIQSMLARYDLVWYVSHHPEMRLSQLEARMRQTGDWSEEERLTEQHIIDLIHERIDALDVDQVKREVAPFVRDRRSLEVWSADFFHTVTSRIVYI